MIKRLLYGLLLSYGLFFTARLIFFIFNSAYFSQSSVYEIIGGFLWGTFVFDSAAIVYVNGLFIVMQSIPLKIRNLKAWQFAAKLAFLIPNTAAFIFNISDAGYFPFSQKRTGSEVFELMKELDNLLLDYLKDYWYLFLILGLMIFLLIKTYSFIEKKSRQNIEHKNFYPKNIALFFLVLFLSLTGARGGFYKRPLGLLDTPRYVDNKLHNLVINTPFQFIHTIQKKRPQTFAWFSKSEIDSLFVPQYTPKLGHSMRKMNVVIILSESFCNEYIGYFNPTMKPYTPFMDSLISQSAICTNAFANGSVTVDALPSVFASIPSFMEENYMYSVYGSNQINSLGSLLAEKGYESSFYFAGFGETFGFRNFIGLSRFGTYHPQEDCSIKAEDMSWGVEDHKFLPYFANELDKKSEPFCSAVLTVSLHHPYKIPKEYQKYVGHIENKNYRCVRYADMSLKLFFDRVKTKSWFNNTLFVFVADHATNSGSQLAPDHPKKNAIPVLFYKPNEIQHTVIEKVTQQIDIIPSIMDFLDYDNPFFSLGKSVFDAENKGFAYTYMRGGIYKVIHNNHYLDYDTQNDKVLDFYHYHDEKRTQSLEKILEDEMKNRIKAVLQIYTNRMAENKLR